MNLKFILCAILILFPAMSLAYKLPEDYQPPTLEESAQRSDVIAVLYSVGDCSGLLSLLYCGDVSTEIQLNGDNFVSRAALYEVKSLVKGHTQQSFIYVLDGFDFDRVPPSIKQTVMFLNKVGEVDGKEFYKFNQILIMDDLGNVLTGYDNDKQEHITETIQEFKLSFSK